jgi:hypothetical protein
VKKNHRTIITAVAGLVLLLASSPARAAADLSLTIDPLTIFQGEVGATVTGTLTNLSGDTVFLNADTIDLPSTLIVPGSVNDSDFFNNAPLSLANGGSTGVIALFTFDVLPDALPGVYGGDYSVLGGVGDANAGNFDVLGSQIITVNTTTPEPNMSLALGIGLIALFCIRRFPIRSAP